MTDFDFWFRVVSAVLGAVWLAWLIGYLWNDVEDRK